MLLYCVDYNPLTELICLLISISRLKTQRFFVFKLIFVDILKKHKLSNQRFFIRR